MRLKLYEDAIRAKAQKKARRNSRGEEGGGDTTPLWQMAKARRVPPMVEAVPVNMVSLVNLA